jgi:hypothetical protein
MSSMKYLNKKKIWNQKSSCQFSRYLEIMYNFYYIWILLCFYERFSRGGRLLDDLGANLGVNLELLLINIWADFGVDFWQTLGPILVKFLKRFLANLGPISI